MATTARSGMPARAKALTGSRDASSSPLNRPSYRARASSSAFLASRLRRDISHGRSAPRLYPPARVSDAAVVSPGPTSSSLAAVAFFFRASTLGVSPINRAQPESSSSTPQYLSSPSPREFAADPCRLRSAASVRRINVVASTARNPFIDPSFSSKPALSPAARRCVLFSNLLYRASRVLDHERRALVFVEPPRPPPPPPPPSSAFASSVPPYALLRPRPGDDDAARARSARTR
mmetsp:Transcript_5952/g.20014  ORF Transcript_5952/g.20014 Transcript_5952/m.20014 type:complete len:234 (+) Transcript_5952:1030-1731(+)